MRGICWTLFLICWCLFAGSICVCAQDAVANDDIVKIVAQDAGYQITTSSYQARIGSDGNLHSLTVNGIEFLDDHIAGSLGASFFFEQPIVLTKLTQQQQDVTAKNDVFTVRYHFEPAYIQVSLRHTNPKGAAFVAVCSQKVAFVEDVATDTVATVPAEYQWGDVQVTSATGEYLRLKSGSRIWGREINRQVWEYSNLAPNKEYAFMLILGRGKPIDPPLDQLTALSATMNHADQVISTGETVALQVHFDNNSTQLVTTEMAIHIESSQGKTILDDRKPLVCAPHQSITLPWSLVPEAADYYRFTCAANLGGAVKTYASTFGYNIPAITSSARRPDDFSKYWERIVAEAKAADIKITQTLNTTYSSSAVKVSEVIVEDNGVRLFSGWLSVPRFPGRYPGLLILPADRATVMNPASKLAERGFVVFCIDPTNQDSIRTALRPIITYAAQNLVNKDTFGMRAMMIRCLQAISALASVKEVDPNRLAITGYGLGGGMAMMLAALDDRVQAVAPDVPFYCNIALGNNRPDWPYLEVAEYLRQNPTAYAAVMKTLSYYDVANFAESITCPVLISAGINDMYSRPGNITGVYNQLPGPHSLKLYIAGHEGGSIAHQYEKLHWLKQVLGGPGPENAAPPPEVAPPAKIDASPDGKANVQ